MGVSGSAPFVIQNDGDRSGISINIWRKIAEENNLSYRLIQQATPREGIRALNKGEIDLLVGPINSADRLNLQELISPSRTSSVKKYPAAVEARVLLSRLQGFSDGRCCHRSSS